MLRPLLLLIPLIIVFFLFISIAQWIGTRIPQSFSGETVHLDACDLPCWISIVPGLTSVQVAAARVVDEFGLSNMNNQMLPEGIITFTVPYPQIDVVLFNERGTVTFLQIANPDDRSDVLPTLGDVLTYYGKPSCVNPYESAGRDWSLIYETPSGTLVFNLPDDENLHFSQSVNAIAISRPLAAPCCGPLPPYSGNMTRTRYQNTLNQTC